MSASSSECEAKNEGVKSGALTSRGLTQHNSAGTLEQNMFPESDRYEPDDGEMNAEEA